MSGYVSIAAVRSALDAEGQLYPSSDSTLDSFIQACIDRASALVDAETGREPGAYAVIQENIRYFAGSRHDAFKVLVDELAGPPSLVEIAESGQTDNMAGTGGVYTALEPEDYYLIPANAVALRIPFTEINLDTWQGRYLGFPQKPRSIKVTGPFGYSMGDTDSLTTMGTVEQAVIIQAVRFFQRARQGFNDVGAISEIGQLRYVKKLDNDVSVILYEGGLVRTAI